MSIIDTLRSWPQRKKMNFIWSMTAAAIVIMVVIWIVIGNYRSNNGESASGTIGSIISNISKDGSSSTSSGVTPTLSK